MVAYLQPQIDDNDLLCLFYAIETGFQLYHGGDIMYEMRTRKHETILLPIQGIFNLPHHIGLV